MIGVIEAKKIIDLEAKKVKPEKIKLRIINSLNYVLAENIKSKCFSPPFHQSAMDGYLLDIKERGVVQEIDVEPSFEIRAGGVDRIKKPLISKAIKIYTGAKIPRFGNVVVPQEDALLNAKQTKIIKTEKSFSPLDNVRLKGSHFRKGEVLLRKDQLMTPAKIALAAASGHDFVCVYKKPSISIIATGDELVMPGKNIRGSMIYESNTSMLCALLNEMGIFDVKIHRVKDKESSLLTCISRELKKSDIILVSGGISVGKYDFVEAVLKKLEVRELFYKVKQKPGKPLFYGKRNQTYVFGLPGNPAASLTCFYEYVKPFIAGITDSHANKPFFQQAVLLNTYTKKKGMTCFLKGKINNQGVEVLSDQESYKLTSFADANCIIVAPEGVESLNKGDSIEYHLI